MALSYYQTYLFQNTTHNLLLVFLVLFLVLIAGYLLTNIDTDNSKTNWLIIDTMLVIFILGATFWVTQLPKIQVSDYGNFWDRMLDYKFGFPLYQTDNDYFSKYAYQTGFLVYVYGVVKLFGYHIFAIQFLNIIYQAITLLLTYLLASKIFNNIKVARLSVLLLMIDLDWSALNAETSNQYLGSMLFLLTFYLIMQNKTYAYILAGFTLTLGCLIRPIGPVIIAGIVVFTLIYLLLNKHDYHASLKVLATLAIYFVLFSLAGWGVKSLNINQYGLSNNDPEWKFVTGLNYQSSGTYSSDMEKLIDPNKTRSQMSKVEKKALNQEVAYLNQNHAWLKLFIKKTQLLWSSRTMATDGANFGMNHSQANTELINYLAYLGSIVLIIFSWIGSLNLFKTKFSNNLYLLILPLLAFAVVQLLIEVQGRYRIEFLPILAIFGGLGLYESLVLLNSFVFRQKKSLSLE